MDKLVQTVLPLPDGFELKPGILIFSSPLPFMSLFLSSPPPRTGREKRWGCRLEHRVDWNTPEKGVGIKKIIFYKTKK